MEGNDADGRKKVEEQVYAPAEGWNAAGAHFFEAIQTLGGEEEG